MFKKSMIAACCAVALSASVPAICIAAAGGIDLVTLDRQPPVNGPIVAHPLMPRELVRQAILIAARDQLGVATRDAVIDEPIDAPTALRLVPVLERKDKTIHVAVRQAGNDTPLWEGNLPGAIWSEDLAAAAIEAEQMSRDVFPTMLQKAGVAGATAKAEPNGAIEADTSQQLDHFELFSQLAAIRLLHAQIHQHGDSPERLAALARAYANYSQLSRFIWGGESQAMAARALIYGQRAVVEFPNDPTVWWARAYSRAVVGLPKSALDDLSAATTKFPTARPPTWATLAGDLAKYDVQALLDATADRSTAPLASFFAFLTVQNSNATAAALNFAEAALKLSPDCQQLIARINDDNGPGETVSGANVLSHSIGRLDALPGMAPDVAALVKTVKRPPIRPDARAMILAALHKDGDTDRGEPSWHVTAGLIEDINFQNVQFLAMTTTFKLAQDPTGIINEAWPRVKNHRYASILAAYREVGNGGPEAFLAALSNVKIDDPMLGSMSEVSQFWLRAPDPITQADTFSLMRGGTDATAPDEELMAQITQFRPMSNFGFGGTAGGMGFSPELLDKICPDSPMVMAVKINTNWPEAKTHINQWLQQVGDHPSVTFAVAQRNLNEHNYTEAAAMFERYVAVSPDSAGFDALAECYEQQHDEKHWLAALNRSLEQPGIGLSHALTDQKIANYFVDRQRYSEALPYAEAAGESYSAWGLDLAAFVNEKVAHWDRAEALVRANAENYHKPLDWLEWCIRTGHGDLAAAKQQAEQYLAAAAGKTDRESMTDRVGYALLVDNRDDAERLAAAIASQTGDPWAGLHAALLAAARSDNGARDAAFDWVVHPKRPFEMSNGWTRPALISIARLLQAAATNHSARLDKIQVAQTVAMDREDEPNVLYYAGRYSEIIGATDDAKDYYQQCAGSSVNRNNRGLAQIQLSRMQPDAGTTQPIK